MTECAYGSKMFDGLARDSRAFTRFLSDHEIGLGDAIKRDLVLGIRPAVAGTSCGRAQ